MAQCKKHGYDACPHCIENERDYESCVNPHTISFNAHQKSYHENQERYLRQIGAKSYNRD